MIMVGTGKFSPVLWCKILDIWFLVHLIINIFLFDFRPFAGKIALSSKTTGQCSHLVHFGYCHYVIKYLMRDMMNYYCLRVFRSRVKRIGKKNSPSFSVPNQSAWLFRCWARAENLGTRIHSVGPEHCFPTGIFFFFLNGRALHTEVERNLVTVMAGLEPAQTYWMVDHW